jgi:hypothetical protein
MKCAEKVQKVTVRFFRKRMRTDSVRGSRRLMNFGCGIVHASVKYRFF